MKSNIIEGVAVYGWTPPTNHFQVLTAAKVGGASSQASGSQAGVAIQASSGSQRSNLGGQPVKVHCHCWCPDNSMLRGAGGEHGGGEIARVGKGGVMSWVDFCRGLEGGNYP